MDEKNLTENNNVKVYNETTKPAKKKRRDKSDLGENFIAPDGGWAWAVCLAAGISNLSLFPCLQQFGLIYRERLYSLGLKGSEISTIINIVMAFSFLTGLINGAMFRRFTFRQVAITGGIFITTGILASAFCKTFIQFVVFFSIIFGFGMGINMSSTSLAVNTYFRNKRRKATGFSWTITGLGPIIFPHVVTLTLREYGVQGTLLIFAAISLNVIVAGMVLQPVLRHVKPQPKPDEEALTSDLEPEYECKYCQARHRKRSIFTSQYTFNDDDADMPGFEITESCSPMLARANDGWYGSKLSLASGVNGPRTLQRRISTIAHGEQNNLPSESFSKPNYFNREKEDLDRYTSKVSIYSKSGKDEFKCTCAEEKALLQKQIAAVKEKEKEEAAAIIEKPLTFMEKVVKFFDLDLLKDPTFLILVLGMTVILFGEINFSVLTPFILNDFGFSNVQISTAMSVIGSMDIIVRFVAPFALEKIKLDNRVLFSIGIIAISIGRAFVAYVRSFNILLVAFILIGFGKGLRTIFTPLIIPSYVPLNRLPAASGLALIANGIFTLSCGPIVGMITDATSYVTTIHFINMMTFVALLGWVVEAVFRRFQRRNKKRQAEADI